MRGKEATFIKESLQMDAQDEHHGSFRRLFGREPQIFSGAPGRINLIGEHTDYNLGYVLPAAINFRSNFLAGSRDDDKVRVWSDHFQQEESFSLNAMEPRSECRWLNYVQGVFWALRKRGYRLKGIDGLIWGNVPLEAGLSSSAALEVSLLFGLNRLYDLGLSGREIASLAQSTENDFVGLQCGLMDPFIAVFGLADHALHLDCLTLKSRLLPLRLSQNGLRVLVYNSRVQRKLSGSAYNQRRKEASAALQELGVDDYRQVSMETLERRHGRSEDLLLRRACHVVSENLRVQSAVEALKNDDFIRLGRLLFESHRSLRDDYEVSCPELDLLYTFGLEFDGCLGARLTGAGFGGSGIALLVRDRIESFQRLIKELAREQGFPRPEIYMVEIGNGAAATCLV